MAGVYVMLLCSFQGYSQHGEGEVWEEALRIVAGVSAPTLGLIPA